LGVAADLNTGNPGSGIEIKRGKQGKHQKGKEWKIFSLANRTNRKQLSA